MSANEITINIRERGGQAAARQVSGLERSLTQLGRAGRSAGAGMHVFTGVFAGEGKVQEVVHAGVR